MSIKRLTIDGYGQLELNNVSFRRSGRIEAQCKLDAASFSAGYAENGMLVAVDKAHGLVKTFATGTEVMPCAIIYSSEHLYDERALGLKNFKNVVGKDEILPRLGYISEGEVFTTNCVCFDDSEYTTEVALKSAIAAFATTPVYGGVDASGAIKLSATAPTNGPVLQVVADTTMPDGQPAVKLIVVKA